MRFMYLWQASSWPALTWDAIDITAAVARARRAQGVMLGIASSIGMAHLADLQLMEWTQEAIATARIEGEQLPLQSVRASAARRLGLADAPGGPRNSRAEATLDVLQAAIAQWQRPVQEEDLLAWHAALFPTGRSGIERISVGAWRTHAEPMQIVTPRLGRPDIVHYEAPPSAQVPRQMSLLLAWFNEHSHVAQIDGLVRAAVAHLWFEAVHPFEDGNGRIGRALAELALAQDLRSGLRLYSLSAAIEADRAGYYRQLQATTGRPRLDVTEWVQWFVGRIEYAFDAASAQMRKAADAARFWADIDARHHGLSASQRKALGRLLEAQPVGFTGGMSTEKYVNLTGVSRATAYRELSDLSVRGLLLRSGQGRGTRYTLVGGGGDSSA